MHYLEKKHVSNVQILRRIFYEEARTLRYQRCSVVDRHHGLRQFTGRRRSEAAEAVRSSWRPEPVSSVCPWSLKHWNSPDFTVRRYNYKTGVLGFFDAQTPHKVWAFF